MTCAKNIIFGLTAKQQLANEIFSLSTPVLSSFGTRSSKTAFNINQHTLSSTYNNSGMFFYKKLTTDLKKESGSGISTSILILNKILEEGLIALKGGKKTCDLQKELQEGSFLITSNLKKISQPIDDIHKLKYITQTASQDQEITDLVCSTLEQLEPHSPVFIEKNNEATSFIEINLGLSFQQGYAHTLFAPDRSKSKIYMENPHIFISNINISMEGILNLLNQLSEKKLLIICENISSQALSMLIANRLKGLLDVVVIKTLKNPYINELVLQNIASLTGGYFFSKKNHDSIRTCSLKDLGNCSRVEITSKRTIIINNKTSKIHHSNVCSNNLFSRMGTIFIGASQKSALLNKYLKTISSIKSSQTALKHGFILGGGLSLFHTAKKILEQKINNNLGLTILCRSCLVPLKKILKNNTKHTNYKKFLLEITKCKQKQTGFNNNTLSLDNLLEVGVFDSTQIIINSILKATQIACEIFSCDVLIEECKDKL